MTSKSRNSSKNWHHLAPFIAAALLCFVALVCAFRSGHLGAAQSVSVLWVIYSMFCVALVLKLGVEDLAGKEIAVPRKRRASDRRRPHNRPRWALTGLGISLVIVVIFAAVGLNFRGHTQVSSPVSMATGSSIRWGMMLSGDAVQAASSTLETKSLGMVGRTQLISDSFDERWADDLSKHRSTPWITLVFGTNPKDPASGLVSITNGHFDEKIRDWARAVKAHKGPILLTVLPQDDANWAVSSAVASGGVPQDSANAWEHIRNVFRKEGATNASFVWAPARPWSDASFAPPASAVDAVAITALHLPGQAWVDPKADIEATAARHPGVPLILLVGADGAAGAKAVWLREAFHAAASTPSVSAIIYHEAAPTESGTAANERAWSLASDSASLNLFRAFSSAIDEAGRMDRTELLAATASTGVRQ